MWVRGGGPVWVHGVGRLGGFVVVSWCWFVVWVGWVGSWQWADVGRVCVVGWFGSVDLVVVWVVAGLVIGIGGCGGGFIIIQCKILLTCVYLTHHAKSVRWLFHY